MKPNRERGFALVAVLWVVAALTLIAAVFMHSGRTQVQLTRNLAENAKAEALADAAVQRALYGLLSSGTDTAWQTNGTSYDVELPGGRATVILYDEGGKIDINRAREDVLISLLISVGVPLEKAGDLAAAIADYRDADSDRRDRGAEDTDYDRAKLAFGAKDALLARNDELRGVIGMADDIYARIEPLVTVYSSRRYVDLASAPEGVLRALPYVTEQQRQQLIADRASGAAGSSSSAMTIMVVAKAETDSGGGFIREAVFRRSSDPLKLFDILSWRHRWPTAAADGGS
jgi:general secretion pathway protein K